MLIRTSIAICIDLFKDTVVGMYDKLNDKKVVFVRGD